MSSPSPFEIGRQVGNNFANVRKTARDESAIEQILSQAMGSGDPKVLQNSIGRILSQVSPERQGMALQYLQNAHSNILKKQEQENQFKREQDAGLVPGINPTAQAAIYNNSQKNKRLSQYGLGNEPNIEPNLNNQNNPITQPNPNISNSPSNQNISSSPFRKLTDDQLVVASGSVDREIAESAKSELKRREEERKIDQREKESWTKFGQDRAKKVLERADELAESLTQKEEALKLSNEAIVNKDLGFFSWDNLAEITGIEGLRSKEGAIFKTAMKEFLLGSISRAGARPNQWIEQQINDMASKIGRSTEANLSVNRAIKNEIDIQKEQVRLTEEIFNEFRNNGKDIGGIGPEINKRLSKYTEEKQVELFNDLRAIKSISEGTPEKYRKVSERTKISPFMVDALLNTFGNDPDKALNEAKKLGYSIE